MDAQLTLGSLAPDVIILGRPIVLLAEGATEPPKELRLFGAGFVETTKGTFKVDVEACASVGRCYQELGRLLHMDYEHASVTAMFAPDPAEAGKAAGQFAVECRNGEIWATNIRWTPKAREKIMAREYLYTSPAFHKDDEGRVLEVLSCALTNDPAIKHREPLMASRVDAATKEQPMKTLLSRLGLADTSSEADAVVALSKIQEQFTALLTLSGKSSATEALGVFTGWKTAADQVAVLSAKLVEIEKVSAAHEIDEIVAKGKADGKLSPALEKLAREMGAKDLTMLKAFVEATPKVVASATHTEKKPEPGNEEITEVELSNCKRFGVDPKLYAENKIKLAREREAQRSAA